MPNELFPVFDMPAELDEDRSQEAEYAHAPLWDYEKGDFYTDSAGRPMYGDGYGAWVFWCLKVVQTERWAHYAYSNDIGIEGDEALKEPDVEAREDALEETITQALLADPMGRTELVTDFEFIWDGDSVSFSCEVAGADGNSAVLNATLQA